MVILHAVSVHVGRCKLTVTGKPNKSKAARPDTSVKTKYCVEYRYRFNPAEPRL